MFSSSSVLPAMLCLGVESLFSILALLTIFGARFSLFVVVFFFISVIFFFIILFLMYAVNCALSNLFSLSNSIEIRPGAARGDGFLSVEAGRLHTASSSPFVDVGGPLCGLCFFYFCQCLFTVMN